jgi:hypothetical protein
VFEPRPDSDLAHRWPNRRHGLPVVGLKSLLNPTQQLE